MRWIDLAIAAVLAALFTAFQFCPGSWCEPFPVRFFAVVFVIVAAAFYLYLLDDERKPLVGTLHRMCFGAGAGLIVAAIADRSVELYFLLALIGAMLGYVGFRWLKHVPI